MANTVERNASSSSSKAVGAFSRQEHELRNPLLGSGSPVVFTPDLERASSASATPPNGQKLLPADDSPQLPSRPSEGNSTVSQVAYNIVNAVVGAGIVGLPHALQMSGLWMGVFLMVFMAWLCDFSVRLLVTTGMRANCLNYEALMERLFGIKGYIAVLVTMFCYDFGAMLTYLIIMGSTGRKIFDEFLPEDILHSDTSPLGDPERRRQICITVLAVVTILPLCLFRDISKLERVAFVSTLTVVVVIGVILYTAIIGDTCMQSASPCPPPKGSVDHPWYEDVFGTNVFTAFGIFAFSFVCHDCAFLIFNTLKAPSPSRWRTATGVSLATAALICLMFAIPGFLAFRDGVADNVLDNYAVGDTPIIIVRALYVLTMAFTYPISFFVCRHIINDIYNRIKLLRRGVEHIPGTPSGKSVQESSTARHLLVSLPLFAASVGITLLTDDLSSAMALTGNVTAVTLAFILPPLCALAVAASQSDESENQSARALSFAAFKAAPRAAALLFFGVAAMFICTAVTVLNIARHK